MSFKTVNEAWQSYLEEVMPAHASRIQKHETRLAFYAGGIAIFGMISDISATEPDTDKATVKIEALLQELKTAKNFIQS
jgi:hypothetical protein